MQMSGGQTILTKQQQNLAPPQGQESSVSDSSYQNQPLDATTSGRTASQNLAMTNRWIT